MSLNGVPLSRFFLLLLTFWTGALTLSIEVFAFRSMALILSSSIVVTSVIIALVIISLSFGYYLAIRVDAIQRLHKIRWGLFIVCFSLPFMALVAPAVTGVLGPFVYNQDHLIAMGIGSLLSLVLLTLPLPLFLGYVSPLLFSCLRQHYTSDQETAARSFIASGIGSLVGSIVPNLILIPFIGMVHSYLLLAGITAFMLIRLLTKRIFFLTIAIVLALSIAASFLSDTFRYRSYLAVEETPYQTIHVWQHPKNDVITMSFNTQIGSQSYLDERLLYRSRSYFDNVLLFFLNEYPSPKNVLMLGSAGSTISTLANIFLSEHVDLSFTNVDIDPAVHSLAKKWFNAEFDNVRFVSDDARAFIQSERDTYDVIILDVYVNELFIPATLYSVEFFQLVRDRLKDNGIVTMNVNGKGAESPIIRAGLGSLGKVFEHVYVTTNINEGVHFAPILISASPALVDFQAMADVNPIVPLKNELGKMPERTVEVDTKNLPFIEDDRAMIEYLSIATFLTN